MKSIRIWGNDLCLEFGGHELSEDLEAELLAKFPPELNVLTINFAEISLDEVEINWFKYYLNYDLSHEFPLN